MSERIPHSSNFRNFAYMRIIAASAMMMLAISCSAQKAGTSQNNSGTTQSSDPLSDLQKLPQYNNFPDGAPVSSDTVSIKQPDDSKLHIRGFGGMFIHYTETTDGYTLYLNEQGIYEYAVRADNGDLKGSGVQAHDPDEREAGDKLVLSTIPKHLRYEGKKLKYLIYKQYKWDESVYYGQQYRQYKQENKDTTKENTYSPPK